MIATDRVQGDSADPFVLRVQRMTDHHILTMRIADLVTWMGQGEVTIEHCPGPTRTPGGREALAVSEEYWKQALDRLTVIRPLLTLPLVTESDVCRVAANHGLGPRTIWRWVGAYRGGGIEALIPVRGFGIAREPHFKDSRVGAVVNQALEERYLKPTAPSKTHVIRYIQDECAAAGRLGAVSRHAVPAHRSRPRRHRHSEAGGPTAIRVPVPRDASTLHRNGHHASAADDRDRPYAAGPGVDRRRDEHRRSDVPG